MKYDPLQVLVVSWGSSHTQAKLDTMPYNGIGFRPALNLDSIIVPLLILTETGVTFEGQA